MNNALQVFDTGIPTGAGLRDPAVIMDEAKERCQVLTAMVQQTQSFTQIGPSKHLRVEAWITLAQFYGCSGRIIQTEDISIGGVVGFKAHAQVCHDQTGTVLSSADAICMQDEANWEKKPLHQIMSMAQTRALSKALAAKFRWVVVLGGFSPTPAEEMGSDVNGQGKAAPKVKPSNEMCLPNYGPDAGKPFSEASVEHLRDYLAGAERSILDEKKARFKGKNIEMRDALKAEIARRDTVQGDGADVQGAPNTAEHRTTLQKGSDAPAPLSIDEACFRLENVQSAKEFADCMNSAMACDYTPEERKKLQDNASVAKKRLGIK